MKRELLRTSTFFVAMTVYVFTLLGWISLNSIEKILDQWGQRSEMTIFLRASVDPQQLTPLHSSLQKFAEQVDYRLQTSDDIAAQLEVLLKNSPSSPNDAKELALIIPPYFVVKAKSSYWGSALFDLFKTIETELKVHPLVSQITYGQSWLEKYDSALQTMGSANIAFLVLLGVTLIFVIGNSIRSHIYSKKEEIEILELVGATPQMINKPFLIEGTLISTGAMFLALFLVTLGAWLLRDSQIVLLGLFNSQNFISNLGFLDWLLALLVSALIGFWGSALCLRELKQKTIPFESSIFSLPTILRSLPFKTPPSETLR